MFGDYASGSILRHDCAQLIKRDGIACRARS
jgi:hypothetical protein